MATIKTLIINSYFLKQGYVIHHMETICPYLSYIFIIYIIINKLAVGQIKGQAWDIQGQIVKCPLSQKNAKGTQFNMSSQCPQLSPCLSLAYNINNLRIRYILGDKCLNKCPAMQYLSIKSKCLEKMTNHKYNLCSGRFLLKALVFI
jgi:hypothetical protein